MQRIYRNFGIALLVSLFCAFVVFIIEDSRYEAPDVAFSPKVEISQNAVDLNSATLEELMEVESLGKSTAEKIIDFRKKQRPFETVEDLMLMKGFNTKKLEKVLGKVYVKKAECSI